MQVQFEYRRPQDFQECFSLLAEYGEKAVIFSGGTDLLVQIRAGLIKPGMTIDVKSLPGLSDIAVVDGWLHIGAAVTMEELIASPAAQAWPVLAEAVGQVGSIQIRNKATLAGNIQNASPAGDGLVAAWGAGAKLLLRSASGTRWLPLDEFMSGPRHTALDKGREIIETIAIPPQDGQWQRFFKVGRRNAMAISVVNGMVSLKLSPDKSVIDGCRIVLGAVAPTPVRAIAAEEYLQGKSWPEIDQDKLSALINESISPISDLRATAEYRRYISGVMVGRLIEEAMGGDR